MQHQHAHPHRHGRRGRGHRHGRRHGFGPWTFQGNFFERGELPIALLSLLADGPMHGYELMKQLEARTNGVYEASAGSIYPTLQQLSDQELVTGVDAAGGKRLFELSGTGRQLLADEAETVARIWARAEDDEWTGWSDATADDAAEITRPAFRLMRTAVKTIATSRDPERAEKVRDILNEARDRIRALREEPAAS
jgi:DNA-binding PadR family transcriptional regulator